MAKPLNKVGVKYDYPNFDPKKLSPWNIDRMVIERVPFNSVVLDLGCATGFIGEYLIKNKNCQVFGIEKRREEVDIARKRLNGVLGIDIDSKEFLNEISKLSENKFDVILAISLIEHLKEPENILRKIKRFLKKDGVFIATTPNIAHWSIRMSLLRGNFDYSEYGILDKTHLHFFNIKTFRQLFEENGFIIKEQVIDAEGGGYPRLSLLLSRFFPTLFAYQILVVAKAKEI